MIGSAMVDKPPDRISLGQKEIPAVLQVLVDLLPEFTGADLESRLQTIDSFLQDLSPDARPRVSAMLRAASTRMVDEASAGRIVKAARDVVAGERVAAPYDHEKAMRAYRAEHRKSFPDLPAPDGADGRLLAKIEEALARIVPMAEAGWEPARSIGRQLRWCRAFVLDERREERPGPFSMGQIATGAFDMHGDEPELANLINEVENSINLRLDDVDRR
jgi:hypothetical protein